MGVESIPTSSESNDCEQSKEKEAIFQKERVIYAVAVALGKNENEVIDKMESILKEAKNIAITRYDKRRQKLLGRQIGSADFARIGRLFLNQSGSMQAPAVGELIVAIAYKDKINTEDLLNIRDRVRELCHPNKDNLKQFDEVISQRLKNNY